VLCLLPARFVIDVMLAMVVQLSLVLKLAALPVLLLSALGLMQCKAHARASGHPVMPCHLEINFSISINWYACHSLSLESAARAQVKAAAAQLKCIMEAVQQRKRIRMRYRCAASWTCSRYRCKPGFGKQFCAVQVASTGHCG
jgi:hypothetical protein